MEKIIVKPKFRDPTDNPENCPKDGTKLKFAHMVPPTFGPEHPEFRCPKCGTYYTNPFLDKDAHLMPEDYAYFAELEAKRNAFLVPNQKTEAKE